MPDDSPSPLEPKTAFIFGGGGKWGAVQAGMAQALTEAGITPDLVLGTSIGAFNGAIMAADPDQGATRLRSTWSEIQGIDILDTSLTDRVRKVLTNRIALHETGELRRILTRYLPVASFTDLSVPFQCVATTVETAAERWFDGGSLIEAILASSAVPGLFPPLELEGRHYYDGGLVNSVPIDRAVELGATRIYALQVGRMEKPLEPPRRLHEAALVAFEIARRNRFAAAVHSLPEHVEVHVLPSGNPIDMDDRRQLKWWDVGDTAELMDAAYRATRDYLSGPGR